MKKYLKIPMEDTTETTQGVIIEFSRSFAELLLTTERLYRESSVKIEYIVIHMTGYIEYYHDAKIRMLDTLRDSSNPLNVELHIFDEGDLTIRIPVQPGNKAPDYESLFFSIGEIEDFRRQLHREEENKRKKIYNELAELYQ